MKKSKLKFIPLEIIPRRLWHGLAFWDNSRGDSNTPREFLTGFITLAVLLLLLAIPAFVFAQDPLITNPAPGFFVDKPTLTDTTVKGIILLLINILLGIVGLVSMIFIIIGGFQYITGITSVSGAGSSEKKITVAKKTITNAIIGLVVVIFSYVMVVVVMNALIRGNVGPNLQEAPSVNTQQEPRVPPNPQPLESRDLNLQQEIAPPPNPQPNN